MPAVVHKKGGLYRLWHTASDSYITGELTRDEVEVKLVGRATKAIQNDLQWVESQEEWLIERCVQCGAFHHTFIVVKTGPLCGQCGEYHSDVAHQAPCLTRPVSR